MNNAEERLWNKQQELLRKLVRVGLNDSEYIEYCDLCNTMNIRPVKRTTRARSLRERWEEDDKIIERHPLEKINKSE